MMLKILILAWWRDTWKECLIWKENILRVLNFWNKHLKLFRVALTAPHPHSPTYTSWVDSPWELIPVCIMLDSQDLSYLTYLFAIPSNTEVSFKKYVDLSGVAVSCSLRNKETLIHHQIFNSLSHMTSSNKLQSSVNRKTKTASTLSLHLIQWQGFEEGMFRKYCAESKDDHWGGRAPGSKHQRETKERFWGGKKERGWRGEEEEGWVGCGHCCGRPLGLGKEWVLILEASRKHNVHTHG